MKIRYLGHSCVEITGRHHILIDPDFTRDPEPNVEYICITHAHKDHIGRVADVPNAIILASADVCEIAASLGVSRERLHPVVPGEQVANVQILAGYSMVNQPLYTFFYMLFRWRRPDPGGTPLSFLVQDEADLLHIGDAHEAPLSIYPDILCLPWRTTPFGPKRYKDALIRMATRFAAHYILPIHYDLPGTEADPRELTKRVHATVLEGNGWYGFHEKKKQDGAMQLVTLGLSYLLGSLPFGLLLARLTTGQDIRQIGSGRTGTTNTLRAAGYPIAIITFILDMAKSAAGVWLARWLAPGQIWIEVLAPIAVIVGHNYSIFLLEQDERGRLRLRGGAGGASALGGTIGLWPPSILILLPVGILIYFGVGYASVATMSIGLIAALIFAVRAWLGLSSWIYVAYGLLAEILLLWALRPNIKNLLNGAERGIGWRARRKK